MTFRNDLDAAHARIESLEREKRELAEQNARLNARLAGAGQRPIAAERPSAAPTVRDPEPKPWPLMNIVKPGSLLSRFFGAIGMVLRALVRIER